MSELIPIKVGNHYRSKRGHLYDIVFQNDDIVVLYDGDNYRIERYNYFRELLSEGFFTFEKDANPSTSEEEIPLSKIDLIGDVAVESMNEEGYTTPKSIDRMKDSIIIEECRGLGKKGLNNIRNYIESEMQ